MKPIQVAFQCSPLPLSREIREENIEKVGENLFGGEEKYPHSILDAVVLRGK